MLVPWMTSFPFSPSPAVGMGGQSTGQNCCGLQPVHRWPCLIRHPRVTSTVLENTLLSVQ